MAPRYTLTYFNVTALGEPIRMLFHYGKIPFEDCRFPQEEWPAIKGRTPFGQVPILEFDDHVVNQSKAIARYVAKLVKLTGKDPLEDLVIDSMVDNIDELRSKIATYHYEADATLKEKLLDPLLKQTLPFLLSKLDTVVKDNNGYFVNGKLTWADVYFVGILDYLNYMVGFDLIEKYSYLQQVCKNVKTIPAIQNYLQTRPKTPF